MKKGITAKDVLDGLKKKGRPKSLAPTKTVYRSFWLTEELAERIKADPEFQKCASFGVFVTRVLEEYMQRFRI